MPRFRISIGALSAVILGAAIVMAAARSPTESWSNGSTSLALLALVLAPAGAILRRGPARAYWAGFAGLGWGYLLLAFGPWSDSHIAPLLINKTIGEYLHFSLGRDPAGRIEMVQFYRRTIPGTILSMYGHQQVAHSLSALLLGLLGGSLARRFASAGPAPGDSIGGSPPMRSPNLAVAGVAALGLIAVAWGVAIRPPGRSADEYAANGTFCAGILALGVAWTAAATLRGPDRAFWAGFALLGSVYLVLVYGPWFEGHVAQLLITETMLRSLQEEHGPYRSMFTGGTVAEQAQYAPRLIGHTMAAMVAGLAGGAACRRFSTPEAGADGRDRPDPG